MEIYFQVQTWEMLKHIKKTKARELPSNEVVRKTKRAVSF